MNNELNNEINNEIKNIPENIEPVVEQPVEPAVEQPVEQVSVQAVENVTPIEPAAVSVDEQVDAPVNVLAGYAQTHPQLETEVKDNKPKRKEYEKLLRFLLIITIILNVYTCFRIHWLNFRRNIIAKPVLYLYPTEDDTNVKVTFKQPDLLTTTYPKFNNEWNVTVDKDGSMIDTNGREYYALYWEEKGLTKVDFSEGFYVEGKDAISFLEDKLDEIGLTEREANEFIMYWLPIMESNEKNLVYFELTESKQNRNELIIEPKVDSLLRLTMHVKKVDKKTNIKEQQLSHFERNGFVAVEWGGINY